MAKKPTLGRGLDSLLGSTPVTAPVTAGSTIFNQVKISDIEPNPNQPRRDFDDEGLEQLSSSIKANGIITPITLRKMGSRYQIIAGERRYRAAKLAGLDSIPAYIRDVEDEKVLELALIENIQRQDLNAIEIALSYSNLLTTLNLTQEQLSERVGKSRATVTNYVRLLNLPAPIQLAIKDGVIEMGHARALAGIKDTVQMLKIFEIIVAEGASVRRAEELAGEVNAPAKRGGKKDNTPFMPEMCEQFRARLQTLFGGGVKFKYGKKGKGEITLSFGNDEELAQIMELLDKIK